MAAIWAVLMGLGAVASLVEFFGADPQSAPQQAVVGVFALYYLILPYTVCRAIEGIVRDVARRAERSSAGAEAKN